MLPLPWCKMVTLPGPLLKLPGLNYCLSLPPHSSQSNLSDRKSYPVPCTKHIIFILVCMIKSHHEYSMKNEIRRLPKKCFPYYREETGLKSINKTCWPSSILYPRHYVTSFKETICLIFITLQALITPFTDEEDGDDHINGEWSHKLTTVSQLASYGSRFNTNFPYAMVSVPPTDPCYRDMMESVCKKMS